MKTANTFLLTRRVEEIIDLSHLQKKLTAGKKLRVKLGIDPNRPDIHLGHAVPLWKLREFQEAGHTAVFIIGDWTAMIGDPSGKDKTRPPLTRKDVEENAKHFFRQAYMILDRQKTEVYMQSEWFSKFGLQDIIKLASLVSVGEMLSHETFRKRLDNQLPFALHEMLYPLLQGYDSVAVKSDVELGAMEQKFNVLMGRNVQKAFNQEPQDVLMVKYLIGLDGKEKMSKSLDNYIGLDDGADEMYGKTMSLPDGLIAHYFELCTQVPEKELVAIKKELAAGKINPKTLKEKLASEIVGLYHGRGQAVLAAENFGKKFGRKLGAEDVKADFTLKKAAGEYLILDILTDGHLSSSRSEARRKIKEGAVSVDGRKVVVDTEKVMIRKGTLLRLGKRFLRIE